MRERVRDDEDGIVFALEQRSEASDLVFNPAPLSRRVDGPSANQLVMPSPLETTMIVAIGDQPAIRGSARSLPTVWGCTPIHLHDYFWLSHGVQVVRRGEAGAIPSGTRAYLLIDRPIVALFDVHRVLRQLQRNKLSVVGLRIHDRRDFGYREVVVSDADHRFVRFERRYQSPWSRYARMVVTTDRHLAELWQTASTTQYAWRRIRARVPKELRGVAVENGCLYDRHDNEEIHRFLKDLVRLWRHPERVVPNLERRGERVFVERGAQVDPGARFVGPAWVGTGRTVPAGTSVIGPAVLWDDQSALARGDQSTRRRADRARILEPPLPSPSTTSLSLEMVLPNYPVQHWQTAGQRSWFSRVLKRGFDVVFSLVALLATLPFYPVVMLLIYLEDGWPFFFSHRRETVGGREFSCYKFRSMRKDAEQIKAKLAELNMADGPQFYMEEDPRVSRVGRWIRKLQIDEWPQFFNVLLGDMSVVGPRPSPHGENQFCPAWREARLSVRPGITGLWQVRRSRRAGMDFQEWIKYDIEYVENRSFAFDLMIIWESVLLVLKLALMRGSRSKAAPAEVDSYALPAPERVEPEREPEPQPETAALS